MANRRTEDLARAPDRGDVASLVASPQDPRAPSSALVLWILIATMLGFAGSMVYSAHVGARLDKNALSIATDASPAIEHLSAARGEVLRIQLAAISALERFTKGAPVDRAPFDSSLTILRRELRAYEALPFYPYEHDHFYEADRAVRSLEAEVSVLLRHLEAKDGAAAVVDLRTALSPAAARSDNALELLINFNAREDHRLGVEIPVLRKYGDRVGYWLAAVTASFGALLMVLVMRAVRRYETLLRAHYKQAMAAKRSREDLLATVSHDLKNPLSVIRLSTHLLRRSADATTGELAERIDRTAERMSGLIGDLLEASKIEAGVLRTAAKAEAAAPLVNSAIEIFRPIANEKSIQLDCEAPPSLPPVLCERDLVSRVFSNLIGNAIKFSAGGSSIAVVAKELPGEVQFSVADSGPGIPVGQLPHVFDRYWQEKGSDRRGTGLGLYIAKGIVEAHGGRIWVESSPGQGTTMSFTLRSVTAPAARDAPSA